MKPRAGVAHPADYPVSWPGSLLITIIGNHERNFGGLTKSNIACYAASTSIPAVTAMD